PRKIFSSMRSRRNSRRRSSRTGCMDGRRNKSWRASAREQPAVDGDAGAADEYGVVGGQEQRDFRHIDRLAKTPCRRALDAPVARGLVSLQDGAPAGCRGGSRLDVVGGAAGRSESCRLCGRNVRKRQLRGSETRVVLAREGAAQRADVDDPAGGTLP